MKGGDGRCLIKEGEYHVRQHQQQETPQSYRLRRPLSGRQRRPEYTRIGVGFDLKNGGISVLYDAVPLSGQIVLLDIATDEKPTAISYSSPTRKPSFEVSMVRDGSGDNSYWTGVGNAWRRTAT